MGIRDMLIAKYGFQEWITKGKLSIKINVEYLSGVNGVALTAAEYFSRMQLPTLAELRRAFETRDDYRCSVLSNLGYGEWTVTLLRDGRELIERPERVFHDQKRKLWVAEGGKVTRVELPHDGWILEYDKPTGFPSRTSRDIEGAAVIFGANASYFRGSGRGLRAVIRYFDSVEHGPFIDWGPFSVKANYKLDSKDSKVGGRACLRNSIPYVDAYRNMS